MARNTQAQKRAARARAEAAARLSADVAAAPPPPWRASGSHARSVGDPGEAEKGSLVRCSKCSSEGKRFKLECAWEWDDQEAGEGHWLRTCAACIMNREGLETLEAAKHWISENARAVASVLPEYQSGFTSVFSAHPHAL